jgi:putative transposase
LELAAAHHGRARRLDASAAFTGWVPQNGFVESFNGRMRDELLNETLFFNLDHARQKLAVWAEDYNTRRPHSSIGYQTPAAYAAQLNATRRPAAQCGSSTARPVAPTAPSGVTNVETLVRAG